MDDKAKKAFLAQLPKFDPKDSEIYNATCHCGSVQYTVTLSPPLERHPIVSCNCSICLKNGYLLVYPTRERVSFGSEEIKLKTYSFGYKRNQHKFCADCGGSVFFDPELNKSGGIPDLLGINVSIIFQFGSSSTECCADSNVSRRQSGRPQFGARRWVQFASICWRHSASAATKYMIRRSD